MPSPNTLPPTTPPPPSAYAAASGVPHTDPLAVHPLCWGSIIAGAIAALAVHLLLTLLGIGLGLQIVEPATDPQGGRDFSISTGIVWTISALLALWLGGWIAGRLIPEANRHLGGLHGFIVWSLATVVTIFALTTGASMLAGSLARLAGKAVGNTAEMVGSVAQGAGDALGQASEGPNNIIETFVQELTPANAPSGEEAAQLGARATREISLSLLRFFTQPGDQRAGEAKEVLIRSIARNTPLDEAQIRRTVDEWIASYERMEQDMQAIAQTAEDKAREVGETASGYVTYTAIWTFLAFVVGALSASWGGACGARSRRLHDTGAVA